jgi:osmotically inducible lipoprotein OsmB
MRSFVSASAIAALALGLSACGHNTEQRAATGAGAGLLVAGPVGAAVGAGVGVVVSRSKGAKPTRKHRR